MPSHPPLSHPQPEGVSSLLLGPSQRGFAPLIHTLYKERSRRLCTLRFDHVAGGSSHSLLRRLHLGSVPVVLRSVPPPWHPEFSTKNISSPPLGGRFVETTRQAGRGVRLVIRVPLRPIDKESDQATDTTPPGRQASTRVRIYLHHLCTKHRRVPENLMGIGEVVKYLCSQQPIDHLVPTRIIRT